MQQHQYPKSKHVNKCESFDISWHNIIFAHCAVVIGLMSRVQLWQFSYCVNYTIYNYLLQI